MCVMATLQACGCHGTYVITVWAAVAEEKPSKGRRSKAAAASGDIYSEGVSARDSEPAKKKRR